MRLVIDTSAYSAFNRGDERLRPFFVSDAELLLPLIVVGELRAGFSAGNRRLENEALLRRFLDMPNVTTLSLSEQTTQLFADIYAQLRQAGAPIGTNDLWIAALAREHTATLLTLDSDFQRVAELKIAEV